jgi:hypothetical protein
LKTQPLHVNDSIIIECFPEEGSINGEAEALDLVAACGEYRTALLLLHEGVLPEAFFHLSTGLAGAILLKFSNYLLKVAAVVSPENIRRGKFEEFVLETNRGRDFRTFPEAQAARDWLLNK